MTSKKILDIFDKAAPLNFPPINDPKIGVASVRMTAFRNVKAEWAVAIERFGYTTVMSGDESFIDMATIFGGQRQKRAKGNPMVRTFFPVSSYSGTPLVMEGIEIVVNDPTAVLVRGIPVSFSPWMLKGCRRRGKQRMISGEKFARAIAVPIADGMFFDVNDLSQICGEDLQVFVRAVAWEHPDILEDELPSDVVSFRSLAEALSSGDPRKFTVGKPNTDPLRWDDVRL